MTPEMTTSRAEAKARTDRPVLVQRQPSASSVRPSQVSRRQPQRRLPSVEKQSDQPDKRVAGREHAGGKSELLDVLSVIASL
jgi:hypothetical protein